VRVTYAKNGTRGQWRAHGRYIARETAREGRTAEAGFSAMEQGIDVADRLSQWQLAGDERMWKLIVSPEFGDRMDLTLRSQLSGVFRRSWRVGVNKALAINKHFQMCL